MNGKQLKNSILQWAIQGKLVPQDPNDEPASMLLERIRVEKEKLIRSNQFYDMLELQWSNKTKEEKQEFISKFIENVTVDKNEKGFYELVNIKFRSSFIEQICKILDYGMFDFTFPCTIGKEEATVTTTVQMDKKELQEYMDDDEEHFVIGGAIIYNLLMPYCKKMYVTQLDKNFEGDSIFPRINESEWEEVSREKGPADRINEFDYEYITYIKK